MHKKYLNILLVLLCTGIQLNAGTANWQKVKGWASKNKGKIATGVVAGALVGGAAYGLKKAMDHDQRMAEEKEKKMDQKINIISRDLEKAQKIYSENSKLINEARTISSLEEHPIFKKLTAFHTNLATELYRPINSEEKDPWAQEKKSEFLHYPWEQATGPIGLVDKKQLGLLQKLRSQYDSLSAKLRELEKLIY